MAATTLYFRPTIAANGTLPAGYLGTWGLTNTTLAGANAKALYGRFGISGGQTTSATITSTGATQSLGMMQFFSDPLKAQTISGSVNIGLAIATTSTGTPSGQGYIVLGVVNASAVLVATLYAGVVGASTTFAQNTEFQAYSGAVALTSYTCAAGDRLVAETGVQAATSGNTWEDFNGGGVGVTSTDHATNSNASTYVAFNNNVYFITTTPVQSYLTQATQRASMR